MQRIKKITALLLCILTLSGVCVFGGTVSAGASGTGAGLAEWALNAYYSGWSYVYGGTSPGTVDCSGLIYTYCGGERVNMLDAATETGSVSSGIPRIHGLGLWRPGHVGVYIGDGMEVDARNESAGVCYQSVSSSYMGWTYWFKHSAVSYPTNGWEKFNGDYYYYENGEYIVNTSRTIDGTTYYFDSKGVSSQTPSDASASGSSDSSGSSGSSGNSSSGSKPTSWRNGSTGEEVEKIQTRLTELGYYTGAIDGSFGDATEQAYRAFQEAAGLTVDGIAGSDRDVLYSDDAPQAPKAEEAAEQEETTEPETDEEEETEFETESNEIKNGDENDKVTEVQAQLAALGYFDIEPTGYFGDYTAQAVKNFQLANNLTVTGVVDEETYALLFSGDAIENPNPIVTLDNSEATVADEGPAQLPLTTDISEYIIANEQNQTYADTACQVAEKTNKVTKKALSKSAAVIPAATTAEVKRTASVWLWFVLVAVILGALAIVFFVRDRKTTRYARYAAKKKKRAAKAADYSSRW